MKNITTIKVKIAGQEVALNVKRDISYTRCKVCARVYGENIMQDNGTYEPWLRPVYQAFIVLTEYTDMSIPEEWGDDELMEFIESDEYKKIWNAIDTQQLSIIVGMGEDLIEHRKQVCRRNGFVEFIDNIKGVLEMVINAYQESPEAAEMLVTGLLENIFAPNDNAVEDIDHEVFVTNEVEDSADV